MEGLSDLGGAIAGWAYDASADGSIVVGRIIGANGVQAYRWTEGQGAVPLNDVLPGVGPAVAYGVSGDGSVVVGSHSFRAFRWTETTGMQELGQLAGSESEAFDVSGDGSTIVGAAQDTWGKTAFRWTEASGMSRIGDLPGGDIYSEGYGVSADGGVIVGVSNSASGFEAFRWTEAGGMVGLGDLPGGEFLSGATSVSADGSVIVGRSVGNFGLEAFVWDRVNGMRSIMQILNDADILPDGWVLQEATAVSADGTRIVGFGRHPTIGTEAWLVDLGAPVPEPTAALSSVIAMAGLIARNRFVRRRRLRNSVERLWSNCSS